MEDRPSNLPGGTTKWHEQKKYIVIRSKLHLRRMKIFCSSEDIRVKFEK